jgi:hypothetical protein
MPGGFQPGMNRFSSMFPFCAGTSLAGAARNAQMNPNPVANPKQPQHGLATQNGIQQLAQKAGFDRFEAQPNWLKVSARQTTPCTVG